MDFDTTMQYVLEQRKYDLLTGRAIDWREQIREQLVDALVSIFNNINIDLVPLFDSGSNEWVFGWISVLRIAGIVFAIGILVWLVFFIRKLVRQRRKKTEGIFQDIDTENSSPLELLKASVQKASTGNQRDAVRYCLAAILLALDQKKIYRISHTKTNRQILSELKQKTPSIHHNLAIIVDIFNMVWFGHKKMPEEQFKNYWQKASKIVMEVEGYSEE